MPSHLLARHARIVWGLAVFALVACGENEIRIPGDAGADDVAADASERDAADASLDGDASEDLSESDSTTEDVVDSGTPVVRGDGIFRDGCPLPGRSIARTMSDPEARTSGPSALGEPGDTLLLNERAAFVVQAPGNIRTYWYYGGNLIDAVAVSGCEQAAPERYDELAFLVGQANLAAFEQSTLRGFRGESVEILNDGSDGEAARVRVYGRDDRFWLIELELVSRAFEAGEPRGLSEPFPIEMWVDYILEPDSAVLRMELGARNLSDSALPLVLGSVNWFADATTSGYYANADLSFGGFRLDTGVPWLAATNGSGAWALGIENRNPGTLNVAGVDAYLDIDQFLAPRVLSPAGSQGDSRIETFFFAVGDSDLHSAVRHLADVNPRPYPAAAVVPRALSGETVDAVSGAALPGVTVTVSRRSSDGRFLPIDQFVSDEQGRFAGDVPELGSGGTYRIDVELEGHPAPAPVEGDLDTLDETRFSLGRSATLHLDVRDGNDRYMPAKAILWRGGTARRLIYSPGEPATFLVEPGDYELSITRGFEYTPFDQPITLRADETESVVATLRRVINTTGYLAMDGHIHGGPSPDSPVTIPQRVLSLAAEGIEVAVSTDHEAVISWAPAVRETGLREWVRTVLGEEVTPPIPEHHNAYPLRQRPGRRGEPVELWSLDIAELHQSMRDRGAGIVALNHPRNGCNYLCHIDYDRLTGLPRLDDPTLLGLEPDAVLWDWNFDTVEYLNGHANPFVDPSRPRSTGLFEDWMSFLNHGHHVTATGVTDVHGLDARGTPRNYFESPTDIPSELRDEMLVSAMEEGRSLVSTGAFARVSINEVAGMGDLVTDTDGTVDLSLRVEALQVIDVTHIMVFVNCDEVLTVDATSPYGLVKFDRTLSVPVTEDAHVVVLGFGFDRLPRNLPQFDSSRVPRFTTNPIYVDADGDGAWTAPGGRVCSYTLRGRAGQVLPEALPSEHDAPLFDFDCTH